MLFRSLHQHKDLSSRIVFEFTQETILDTSPEAEANLRYLSEMGFRLSMDQVSLLNLDFARLKRLGIRFVKVRASTCDLCTGLDMPSCVYACPHDAAHRVEPQKFFELQTIGLAFPDEGKRS